MPPGVAMPYARLNIAKNDIECIARLRMVKYVSVSPPIASNCLIVCKK